MTARATTPRLADVLETLEREQLVEPGWADTLAARPGRAVDATPWFVRAMVGFGAWLAALLLIAFVSGVSLAATGRGYSVLAVVFLGTSLALRRAWHNDFMRQLTLAMSLAGQGLLAIAILQSSVSDREIKLVLASLAALNAVWVFVFPDKTHRFLSVVAVVACVCGLLYAFRAQAILPVIGPALAVVLIGLFRVEPRLARRGWLGALGAVRAGVLISAFGCLTLSTFYVLPEMVDDFTFYPRPWISTLLFGVLLIWLEREFIDGIFGDVHAVRRAVAYGLTALVVLVSLPAPGLILGLLVCVIGGIYGSALYRSAGIAFVAFFTATYFYGIDVGMLVKSATLVGTGLLVLLCRWLFIRATNGEAADPSSSGGAAASARRQPGAMREGDA